MRVVPTRGPVAFRTTARYQLRCLPGLFFEVKEVERGAQQGGFRVEREARLASRSHMLAALFQPLT